MTRSGSLRGKRMVRTGNVQEVRARQPNFLCARMYRTHIPPSPLQSPSPSLCILYPLHAMQLITHLTRNLHSPPPRPLAAVACPPQRSPRDPQRWRLWAGTHNQPPITLSVTPSPQGCHRAAAGSRVNWGTEFTSFPGDGERRTEEGVVTE